MNIAFHMLFVIFNELFVALNFNCVYIELISVVPRKNYIHVLYVNQVNFSFFFMTTQPDVIIPEINK